MNEINKKPWNKQLKAERRKNNADFFKRYGGRKPNIVSVNGKPINLNEDEAEEEDEKSLTSSDQKAESTETTTKPSNDLRKFFFPTFSARRRLRNESRFSIQFPSCNALLSLTLLLRDIYT